MLPDEDGMSVLKKLRSQPETEEIPVMMVTAKTTELDKVKGLDSGADDYITKPFGVMELISRVKALLRRAQPSKSEKVLSLDEITLYMANRSVEVSGAAIELTYKDVLMEKIWGIDYLGESRTLDMHIKTLRKKLGDQGEHIKTVRNVGYLAKYDEKN